MYGDIFAKAASRMREPEVEEYFIKAIQRVMPKSYAQAKGEYVVTRRMIENFGGDNPRFTFKGFSVPGDHTGQISHGYRWPYGPVLVVAPFNFPLEIPALQTLGALMAGNKVMMKSATKVSMVMEQFYRFLHDCGMPKTDLDMLQCPGRHIEQFLVDTPEVRLTQFTGSSGIANRLAKITNGKVKLEDAGFDWKVLGPDVQDFDYVAWQCDQDAYAAGGQKCSATSILFAHENWMEAGLIKSLKAQAAKRCLKDLTNSPVLSWNNKEIKAHIDAILEIPGARLLFGGNPLTGHTIPSVYGAFEPTAVVIYFFIKFSIVCAIPGMWEPKI